MDRQNLTATLAVYDAQAAEHTATFARYVPRRLPDLIDSARTLAHPGRPRVLDLGCGGGRDLLTMTTMGVDAIGLDASEAMLRQAQKTAPHARFLHAYADMIPLPSRYVDAVWCSAGLVHLGPDETAAALAEAARVAKPGATLFVSVRAAQAGEPASGWEPSPFGNRWYQRWTISALEQVLTAAGWTVRATVEDRDSRRDVRWLESIATR